jgi:hypothetical protein
MIPSTLKTKITRIGGLTAVIRPEVEGGDPAQERLRRLATQLANAAVTQVQGWLRGGVPSG